MPGEKDRAEETLQGTGAACAVIQRFSWGCARGKLTHRGGRQDGRPQSKLVHGVQRMLLALERGKSGVVQLHGCLKEIHSDAGVKWTEGAQVLCDLVSLLITLSLCKIGIRFSMA